ncbi:hypothetical protein D3C72_1456760 [compost metagenome]
MCHYVNRRDIRIALQNILRQLSYCRDLLRVKRWESDVLAIAARQIDDLNANRGIVEVRTIAPLAGAGVPGPLDFIDQIENPYAAKACRLIGWIFGIRHQIMGADRLAGQ